MCSMANWSRLATRKNGRNISVSETLRRPTNLFGGDGVLAIGLIIKIIVLIPRKIMIVIIIIIVNSLSLPQGPLTVYTMHADR